MVTVLVPRLTVARSCFPSSLKSPMTKDLGEVPTAYGEPGAGLRTPAPLPRRIVTLVLSALAVARSCLPSPLKSPATADIGDLPTATVEPGDRLKLPPPSPSKTTTLEYSSKRS